MYKVTTMELRKPAGSEDNEADDYGITECSNEGAVIEAIRALLPTLGGTYGRWVEISREGG